MTIEKAIELLKAGRYNELEYLEAKNMAVEALEHQMKNERVSADKAFTHVNLALKKIDSYNLLIQGSSAEIRAEFQKALQELKTMNGTAENIIAICDRIKKMAAEDET